MRPLRSIRVLAAAALALSVASVGLVGVTTASAAVDPYVQFQISVHGNPTAVAITPDSQTILVTSNTERLFWIDAATRRITHTVDTCTDPTDVAITPDGLSAFVVCTDEMWQFSIAGHESVNSFGLFGYAPQRLAITPDGTRAYITDSATARLVMVDLDLNVPASVLPLQNSVPASDVAISPDGKFAMAVTPDANRDQFDIDPNSATYNTLVRSDAAYSGYASVVFSPDSQTVYTATNDNGWGSAEVCDSGLATRDGNGEWVSTGQCGYPDQIDPRGAPWAIAISPDGNTLYTANNQGTVSIINTVDPDIGDNYDLINDNDPVTAIAAAANGEYLVAAQYNDGITIVGITGAMEPEAPSIIAAVSGYESATVSFTAGGDGGSPITKYQYRLGGGSWIDAVGTTSPITITGLTNYTTYSIRLRAVNAVGASERSGSREARPRNIGPVLNSVTALSATSVRADFSGVLFGGVSGIRYAVSVYDKGTTDLVSSCSTKPAGRSCTVTGLAIGTEYDVSVTYYFRFPGSPITRWTLPSNTVTTSITT